MIIEKITDRDGTEVLQDKETGKRYARIVVGVGWPRIKPGFAVVVGEDFNEDPSLKTRHLWIFAEIEEEDLETLFQKCLESRDRYQIETFLANTDNRPMMEFLYDFKRGLKEGIYALSFGKAPFPEDLEYHGLIIQSRIRQGEKSLHFPEKTLLKGYLMEIGKEEIRKADVLDHPAIAALGYALSHIKSYPFVIRRRHQKRNRARDWRVV